MTLYLGKTPVGLGRVVEKPVAKKKYGATVDSFLPDVSSYGSLSATTQESHLVFTGVKSIAADALRYKFAYNKGVKTVVFPDLTTASGTYAFEYAFYYATGLTSISFPNLTSISGNYAAQYLVQRCSSLVTFDMPKLRSIANSGLRYGCYYCTNLTTVNLPALQTIGSGSLYYGFGYCSKLETIDLPSVTTVADEGLRCAFAYCTSLKNIYFSSLTRLGNITGATTSACTQMCIGCTALETITFPSLTMLYSASTFLQAFQNCTNMKHIYFPALKSTGFNNKINHFNKMLSGVSGCTVHFPSNLESVIGSWADITGGMAGTDTVILFDLPATT